MTDAQILKLYSACKVISQYQSFEKLRKNSEKEYGCSYTEALEMAYDNVLMTAKNAIKGLRPSSFKNLK